jgi:hypothetical protein
MTASVLAFFVVARPRGVSRASAPSPLNGRATTPPLGFPFRPPSETRSGQRWFGKGDR